MKPGNLHIAIALLLLAAIIVSGCPKPEDLIAPTPAPVTDVNKTPSKDINGTPDPWKPTEGAEVTVSLEDLIGKCLEKGGVDADNCLVALGKEKKEAKVCERITTISKDKCYYEIAIAMPDYHACYEIYEEGRKNLCFKIAGVAMGKESACIAISDTVIKDDCYDSLAYDKRDPKLCNKISDISTADACVYDVAQLTGDAGTCAYVSGAISNGKYLRDSCYLGVAPSDASTCGRLIDEVRKQACYVNLAKCDDIISDGNRMKCYDDSARANSSYEMCLNIPEKGYKEMREACIDDTVAANPSKDGCVLTSTPDREYACYKSIGISLSDIEICNLIVNDRAIRDDCVLGIAEKTNNAELCKEIVKNDFSKRNYCYARFAVANLKLELCEGITSGANYIKCYSDIAIGKGEPDICATITKEFWTLVHSSKSECYYRYAVGTLDADICDKITDSNFSGQCRNELE